MELIDWLSIIGSIASIVGLMLYFLEKREMINFKIPLKFIVILISATLILGAISLSRNNTKIEIQQDKNNDDNQINVKTN